MLDELCVENLGVIRSARIEPGAGFTVITGETGAGKTLLLGALRLLLGSTADRALVGPFSEEAVAEGRLITVDGEIGAARRLTRGGRSRAYLDGSIASAGALERATAGSIEIVGQHDQIALTRPAAVRTAIDQALDSSGLAVRAKYVAAWKHLLALRSDRDRIGGDRTSLIRERDLTAHQIREIDAAGLTAGEDASLATMLARLRNAEDLRARHVSASDSVDTARSSIGDAVAELRRAASLDPSQAPLVDAVEAIESQIGDAAYALASMLEDLDADPEALEAAERRSQALAELCRRYGPSLAEVLSYRDRAQERLRELDGLLDRSEQLDEDITVAETEVGSLGGQLADARRRAGSALADAAIEHLTALGFSDPLVEVVVESTEPTPHGADRSRIHFASDRRLEPGELAKVASGGELSRLVLALRLAGGTDAAVTLVFDEIDAGLGGTVALTVGRMLAGLSERHQVLCVSHLPQVAAFADRHYVVDRSDIEASVRLVDGDERLAELARMLGGMPESKKGREAANELLAVAARG